MATLDRLAPPPSVLRREGLAWRPRRAIAAALALATAIALLQVVQSSGQANVGQRLQRLEQDRAALTAQNHELEAEVAALSSLDRVERAARERLGMVPAGRVEHLSVAVEAPAGPLLPRPLVQAAPAAPAPEPWWRSLLKALPLP